MQLILKYYILAKIDILLTGALGGGTFGGRAIILPAGLVVLLVLVLFTTVEVLF